MKGKSKYPYETEVFKGLKLILYSQTSYQHLAPRLYNFFFMLNSAEHEIFSANKYENAIY